MWSFPRVWYHWHSTSCEEQSNLRANIWFSIQNIWLCLQDVLSVRPLQGTVWFSIKLEVLSVRFGDDLSVRIACGMNLVFLPNYVLSVSPSLYIYISYIHIYIDAFNLFGGAQFPSFPHCWSPSSFWGIRCHVVQNCCTHDLGWHNLDGYQNTAWFQVTCFKHMSNVNPTCLLIQYDTMKIWQHDQWQFEQCLKPSIVYLLVLDGQKLNPLDGRKVNPWFATVRQILDRIIHCHSILSTFINHIQ